MQMMTVQNTSIGRDIHKSTLEQYVKAAFRAYACNEKKCVPTVEQIFLILIDMFDRFDIMDDEIYSANFGTMIPCHSVRLTDIDCLLKNMEIEHVGIDSEEYAKSQNVILRRW